MAFNYSKKVLLICENNRIVPPIRHGLNKCNFEIATEYLNLHSLSAIRKAYARTGKTAFIRTELMRFIKERGYPQAVIMDCQIEMGEEPGNDPDVMKLLKTMIISYIILSRGAAFEKLRGNFLLITKGQAIEKQFGIGSDPHKILGLLKTENQVINTFINEMKQDRELFEKLFLVRLLDSELPSGAVTSQVDAFLGEIAARQKAAGLLSAEKPAEAPAPKPAEKPLISTDERPAKIVYKIDPETVYEDGQIVVASDEHASLAEKEFYVLGSWANKTQLDVAKKIAHAVIRGLADKKRFTPAEKLVFNIDERCTVDATTALSMAQLFITILKDFKKIAIIANEKNGEILRKAQGFTMIRTLVTIKS